MRYVNSLIFSYVGAECSFLCRIFLKKLTYPGAQAPHGMVQLSPDNGLPGWDRIAGYFYPDSTIAGFSHTHTLAAPEPATSTTSHLCPQ